MRRVQFLLLSLITCLSWACPSHPSTRGWDLTDANDPCGSGERVALPESEFACVYRQAIVIETGFDCPPEAEFLHRFGEDFTVCATVGEFLRADLIVLDDFRVSPGFELGSVENAADILWVVDNSGSMCQEQKILRDNFDDFIGAIELLDAHIAVTTTHMASDYVLEPVARPGRIQSQPQPVPGFDRSCHQAVDARGEMIPGDYGPVRDSIEVAVSCMRAPDARLLAVSNADIECALYNQPNGCTIELAACGGAGARCEPEDLFPAPTEYRTIPLVLRTEDYRLPSGALDVTQMKADFACMSLVGTRGYGIEKGLSAAVTAVSPAVTGGASDPLVGEASDPSAANHGFIRRNSRFGLFIVTDENDCSHDGSLDEATTCGGDVCEFANDALNPRSLIPISTLRDDFLSNLEETKGRTVGDKGVFVASIHGEARRFVGPAPMVCDERESYVEPTCATALGVSFSGDRYERFLAEFPAQQSYPQPDPDGTRAGWMCAGDFTPALQAIGELLRQVPP